MSAVVDAVPVEAARRRRGAPVVVVATPTTFAAPASAFAVLARADGGAEQPGGVVATIHASLRLPFHSRNSAAAGGETHLPQPTTQPEVSPADITRASPPAAPETQSISAWLQDQRRVTARQAEATQKAATAAEPPPTEAPPLSLNQHRATQRKAVRTAVDVSAFKKPRVEKVATEPEAPAAAAAFDFRAARKQLPHGGGLALAGAGAAAEPPSRGAVVKPARVPFALTAGVVEPFKPGKRSSAFPQSGNRTQTFNG